MRLVGCFATAILFVPQGAFAQDLTLESLAKRVDLLEQENAELRSQLAQLSKSTPAGEREREAKMETPVAEVSPPAATYSLTAQTETRPWAGGYAGVSIGGQRVDYKYSASPTNPLFDENLSKDGPALGAQLGYHWQGKALVGGLEIGTTIPFNQRDAFKNDIYKVGVRYEVRLTGQLGYAYGPWLVYGTGGIQLTNINTGYRYEYIGQNSDYFRYLDSNEIDLVYGVGIGRKIGRDYSIEIQALASDPSLQPSGFIMLNRTRSLILRINRRF